MYLMWALFAACVASSNVAAGQSLEGLIEPYDVVDISSQIPGVLDDVPVRRGDRVTKGQVLARLKSDLDRVAVDLARAQLGFAKRRAERNAELFKKELLSVHEQDEMETEIEVAALQLRQAEERLKLRTIRSPINGVVIDKKLSPGEYVGESAILTVAQIDPLNVLTVAQIDPLNVPTR